MYKYIYIYIHTNLLGCCRGLEDFCLSRKKGTLSEQSRPAQLMKFSIVAPRIIHDSREKSKPTSYDFDESFKQVRLLSLEMSYDTNSDEQ